MSCLCPRCRRARPSMWGLTLAAAPKLLGTPHHSPPPSGCPQHLKDTADMRPTGATIEERALPELSSFCEQVGPEVGRAEGSHLMKVLNLQLWTLGQ